jgi:hypothetical protein
MSSSHIRPVSVDPWVAPRGRLQSDLSLSRQAAERSSVLQAIRGRRIAARSNRSVPRPVPVEPAGGPSVADSGAPVRQEDLTSVG